MGTKKHTSSAVTVSCDSKRGRMIPAGHGVLKGQYVVRGGIDITKPILEQVGCRHRPMVAPKKRGKG
jgi:hypothetical protein